MPYDIGATTGYADLKSRIHTFLQDNGWTLSGTVIYKGNVFAQLTDNTAYLQLVGGQGESGGALTDTCPAISRIRTDAWGTDVTFPCTYHFFVHTSPDVFMCVINHNTLNVQWMTFGEVNKYGAWNGGQYFGASYNSGSLHNVWQFSNWRCRFYNTQAGQNTNCGIGYFWASTDTSSGGYGNMQMVCDLDGSAGDWIDNHGTLSTRNFNGSYLANNLVPYSPNTFNSQAVLVPIHLYHNRPSDFSSVIGEPGHTRYVNIKHYNAADIITLGAEKWMVFPHHKKSANSLTDPAVYPSGSETGYLGFAVRYDGP
jgi:hypothetical protein